MISNDQILPIIDFTLASTKTRLFVIDLKNYKLLFFSLVAHGRNTGLDKALYFQTNEKVIKVALAFILPNLLIPELTDSMPLEGPLDRF